MREDEGFLTPARMVIKRVRGMEWNSPYPEKDFWEAGQEQVHSVQRNDTTISWWEILRVPLNSDCFLTS